MSATIIGEVVGFAPLLDTFDSKEMLTFFFSHLASVSGY
jgi:hypothetical protein